MYPYPSSLAMQVLYEERIAHVQDDYQHIALARPARPVMRTVARVLGHTFVALGNRLEHLGQ